MNSDDMRPYDFGRDSISRGTYPRLRSRRRRSRWKWAFLLVVGIGVFLAFRTLPGNGTVPATPTALDAKQAAVGSGAVPVSTSLPTIATTPLPSPTVDPVRPLSGPVAPKVVDGGPAPVRKPGTADPKPTTDHVIVVDGASGAILFHRNAYEPVAPASLTKVMTAILGIEHGIPSEHVKIDVDARQMPNSSLMGLEPGFDVTLQDLLYGLLLPSGNDAALAIARYVAGSDDRFVTLMNQKARWLGLKDTHFANPHGLDASDHYSCPYDMVVMARYAMQYPIFRQIVGTKSYEVKGSNIDFTIDNVNPILTYPGAVGIKTGLTDSAGRSLVAAATRGGHTVYVAFMRSQSGDLIDGTLLFDWAFNSFTWPDQGAAQETPAH